MISLADLVKGLLKGCSGRDQTLVIYKRLTLCHN